MKSLDSFLNPKRKENARFMLSDAFISEDGKPIEWEMRQLSAKEGIEVQKQTNSKEYSEMMIAYVAHSIVYPNLKDKELLDGLTQKEGRPILKVTDALKAITTDAEMASLISRYISFNELTTNFNEKVTEVKN